MTMIVQHGSIHKGMGILVYRLVVGRQDIAQCRSYLVELLWHCTDTNFAVLVCADQLLAIWAER